MYVIILNVIDKKEIKIENLVMDTYSVSSKTCNLYFHGFPGPGNRKDIYDEVFVDNIFPELITSHDEDFCFFYYSGVYKSSSEFSFLNCFDDGMKAFEYISSKYESVNLICRSWGSVVGTHVLSQNLEKVNKTTLLTPYCFIPSRERVDEVLVQMIKSVPDILSMDNYDYYVDEIDEVRSLRSFIENISKIGDKEVSIIAATKDQIIPIQITRETSKIIKNLKYFEVDQDHDLKSHDEIKEIFKKIMK